MTDEIQPLDAPPTATVITDLRSRAREQDKSIQVTFPTTDNDRKRLVVSPRGTCVVLNDTREDSFIPSVPADDIAAALRA